MTTDTCFASVPITDFSLQKNIRITGALKTKKPGIPAMMKTAEGKEIHSSKFIFSVSIHVVSYASKKNKTFRVPLTQFVDDSVSSESHKNTQRDT